MADLKYLKKYSAETDICTLCGTCRTVCPVFLEEGTESSSTRGRISLIHGLISEELNFTKNLSGKMYACLNCRKCVEICPANVNYADLITAAKVDINLSKTRYFRVTFLKYLFNSSIPLSNLSHKILRYFRKVINKNDLNTRNFIGKFVYNILKLPNSAILPPLPERFFFNMNNRHELVGEQKKRVALFLGCGGNFNYPETSDHLIGILRRNGIEVLIPENQVCCGSPLLDNGSIKLAKNNALKNLNIFNNLKDVSAIITQCSNCTEMLNNQYRNFLEVGNFKIPVMNSIEFIRKENIPLSPRFSEKISTHAMLRTYKEQNIKDLIVSTVDSVFHKDNIIHFNDDKCCGASELYNIENYDTRKNITDKFLGNYTQQGVKYIACNSFACIQKINEAASHLKSYIKAVGITDIFE
ncbi:MAG: (Fe-S)-binding protein [Candidatus Delongbacteria bacterium]|nr:(Fe-S)-binding protein [Candidatus Delongbacteria bacterium]